MSGHRSAPVRVRNRMGRHAHTRGSVARRLRDRALAGLAALGVAAGGALLFPLAAQAAESAVTEAVFQWSINDESTGGAYFGGCNFLVPGKSGDAGSSRLWKADDAGSLYPEGDFVDGNVSVKKADGSVATFAQRCNTAGGATVNGKINAQAADNHTGDYVEITGGTGTIDPETNSGTIQWEGSFTIVYYGGMTYWTITDPKLEIENGKGRFVGTYSGVGADMDDPSVWIPELPAKTGTIIELQDNTVDLTEDGFTVTPDFLGKATELDGRNPQVERTAENESWWGAFPDAWIEFNQLTNQDSYWYTTAGGASSIQPRKAANPVTVTYTIDDAPRVSFDDVGDWPPLQVPASRETLIASLQNIALPVLDAEGKATDELEPVRAGSVVQAIAYDGPTDYALPPAEASEGTPYTNEVSADGRATVGVSLKDIPLGRDQYGDLEPGSYQLAFLVDGRIIPLSNTGREDHSIAFEYGVAEPEGPVKNLTAEALTSSAVAVSWEAPDGGQPAGYRIDVYEGERAQGDAARSVTAPGGSDQRNVTGLKAQTTYAVTVTPTLAGQDYETSDPVTVRTLASADGGGGDDPGNGGSDRDDPGSTGGDSDGAVFYWGLNNEANSGAFYGGCNFLSAGRAGDSGSARVWTASDGLYSPNDGAVTIEKPNASGSWTTASWDTKCQDRNGQAVSTSRPFNSEPWTESRVKITGGQVEEHDDGSVTVRWEGTFTVAFYGGMTYWWASDPVLELDASGDGEVTATASGYGADMFDPDKWVQLEERTVTLADLKGIDTQGSLEQGYFEKAPEYLGVRYAGTRESGGRENVGGANPEDLATEQAARTTENEAYWGSFPASFVDFQADTGQFSYWFTSDGVRDPYKPALPLTVSFDGDYVPPAGKDSGQDAGSSQPPANSGGPAGNSGSAGNPSNGAPDAAGSPDAGTAADATGGATTAQAGAGALTPLNPWVWGIAGASVLAIGGANWAVWSFIRRKIGLDPKALL